VPAACCMAPRVEFGDASIPRGANRAGRAPSSESFRRLRCSRAKRQRSSWTRGRARRRHRLSSCGNRSSARRYRCRKSSSIVYSPPTLGVGGTLRRGRASRRCAPTVRARSVDDRSGETPRALRDFVSSGACGGRRVAIPHQPFVRTGTRSVHRRLAAARS
jgi:hypothetical protein